MIPTVEVYLDECNIHGGTDIVTVATAWAAADTWKQWATDWKTAIAPLTAFHSYDVWNAENRWKGWKKQCRDDLCRRAMAVISKHAINGRIGELNRHLLEKELGGASALKSSIVEHPYYASFIWVVKRTMELLQQGGTTDARFIHEVNDFKDGAREHFDILKRKLDCPGFSFSIEKKNTKDLCEPLQCADAFAYFGMKKLRNWQNPSFALEAADNRQNRIQFCKVTDEQVVELAAAVKANST
jgi:hypothetical protein